MRVRLTDTLKRKQLKKGLDQLSEEGAVQVFFDPQDARARSHPGRGRRPAVRGGRAPAQGGVRRHRAFESLPVQPRALGRRGATSSQARSSKRRTVAPSAWSTSKAARWCFSATNGRCARTTEEHPELQFIAAVQPGRTSRS